MRGRGWSLRVILSVACLGWLSAGASAQQTPQERYQQAVALLEERRLPDAREAFQAILAEFDTPENRADIEYDSLLAGSLYQLGETYFLEDRFEEAAAQYQAAIGAFRTYQPESLYHLGLSQHYRQDCAGAIATLGDLASQYPGSPQAPQALYYKGICYELLKDKLTARASFQMMVDRYPQHTWTKKALTKVSGGEEQR